ncbi:hypothetical protein [Streptomyces nojiriensis]|uniref:hypothetical protein n=1 Tax=Streptomyces nojiriensis TaxID=66374 RepID=UPI00367AB83D
MTKLREHGPHGPVFLRFGRDHPRLAERFPEAAELDEGALIGPSSRPSGADI